VEALEDFQVLFKVLAEQVVEATELFIYQMVVALSLVQQQTQVHLQVQLVK
jgi:hypothetical protein